MNFIMAGKGKKKNNYEMEGERRERAIKMNFIMAGKGKKQL